MSVVKVIEVISEGETIEAALKNAIAKVAETVKNVRQINVEHIEARVENNQIHKFRVNSKISFVVED